MTQTQNPSKAALWMVGAVASFTAMALGARAVSGVHDTFEIMAARSGVGFVILIGITTVFGRLGDVSAQRLGGHILRNLVHFTGQNLWFWALALIPLAQVFALEFTTPLWVLLFSPLLLGEKLTRPKVVAGVLGFAGILIVTRPFGVAPSPGVLAAAGSAVFFAMTAILTKRLTREETLVSILFWLTGLQFVFGMVGVLWDGVVHWPDARTLPWLVLIGCAGLGAHLSLTSALRLAPASFVAPLDFVRLPVIAVIGTLWYGEALDPWVLAGGAVIFVGIWLNLRSQLRLGRNSPDLTLL